MELATDVSTAAYDLLHGHQPFQTLVTEGIIGVGMGEGAPSQPWLFQGLDSEGRPRMDPEGTGKAVIVLQSWDSWSGGNNHNTAQFPVLQVLIYADSTRASDGSPVLQDAKDRAKTVYEVTDSLFHDAANRRHQWPGLYVVSSVRGGGPSMRTVPGTQDYTVRLETTYNLVTG
jgi:hypothetical protein